MKKTMSSRLLGPMKLKSDEVLKEKIKMDQFVNNKRGCGIKNARKYFRSRKSEVSRSQSLLMCGKNQEEIKYEEDNKYKEFNNIEQFKDFEHNEEIDGKYTNLLKEKLNEEKITQEIDCENIMKYSKYNFSQDPVRIDIRNLNYMKKESPKVITTKFGETQTETIKHIESSSETSSSKLMSIENIEPINIVNEYPAKPTVGVPEEIYKAIDSIRPKEKVNKSEKYAKFIRMPKSKPLTRNEMINSQSLKTYSEIGRAHV